MDETVDYLCLPMHTQLYLNLAVTAMHYGDPHEICIRIYESVGIGIIQVLQRMIPACTTPVVKTKSFSFVACKFRNSHTQR